MHAYEKDVDHFFSNQLAVAAAMVIIKSKDNHGTAPDISA